MDLFCIVNDRAMLPCDTETASGRRNAPEAGGFRVGAPQPQGVEKFGGDRCPKAETVPFLEWDKASLKADPRSSSGFCSVMRLLDMKGRGHHGTRRAALLLMD